MLIVDKVFVSRRSLTISLVLGTSTYLSDIPTYATDTVMGLLPNTQNCRLHMPRECRERFPCHRIQRKPLVSDPDMHHGTCVKHVPWCMSGFLTHGGMENVSDIPGACTTRNYLYVVRGPCPDEKKAYSVIQYVIHLPVVWCFIWATVKIIHFHSKNKMHIIHYDDVACAYIVQCIYSPSFHPDFLPRLTPPSPLVVDIPFRLSRPHSLPAAHAPSLTDSPRMSGSPSPKLEHRFHADNGDSRLLGSLGPGQTTSSGQAPYHQLPTGTSQGLLNRK